MKLIDSLLGWARRKPSEYSGLTWELLSALEVATAKRDGATQYAYVSIGSRPDVLQEGESYARGRFVRGIANERWPGAILDSKASDFDRGIYALLLPKKVADDDADQCRDCRSCCGNPARGKGRLGLKLRKPKIKLVLKKYVSGRPLFVAQHFDRKLID